VAGEAATLVSNDCGVARDCNTLGGGMLHLHGPPLHSWRSNSSNFGEGTDLFYIL
jgi:hypothetical protein